MIKYLTCVEKEVEDDKLNVLLLGGHGMLGVLKSQTTDIISKQRSIVEVV